MIDFVYCAVVAGVTVEERAASQRLPDRISIGVLARTFTDDLVNEVIDAADAREVRFRLLPARLTLVFVLACWLFMRSGYGQVMGKIADAHVVDGLAGWLAGAHDGVACQGAGAVGAPAGAVAV